MKQITVNQFNADQAGLESRLLGAVDVLKDGTRFPLILTDDCRKVDFMTGVYFSGNDYWKWTRSNVTIYGGGMRLTATTPPVIGFNTPGTAYTVIDLGYEAPLQAIFYGYSTPSNTTLTVRLGVADTYATAAALLDGAMTTVTSGMDLSTMTRGRYLKIKVTMTASTPIATYSPSIYNITISFTCVKQMSMVLDWGTLTARAAGGTGQVAWPSGSLTCSNLKGEFAEQMAIYNIIAQPFYLFKFPHKALPTDFEQIFTGIVDEPEFDLDKAVIKYSKTKYHLMQMFPRLKASDWGRVENGTYYLPAPFGNMEVTVKATVPAVNQADERLGLTATAKAADGASGGTWKFAYNAETDEFDVTYGTTSKTSAPFIVGSYTCTNGGDKQATVTWSADDPFYLAEGDGFSFTVLLGGGITAVRIDPGTAVDDEDQVWALAQWPIVGNVTLYVDNEEKATEDYDLYLGNTYAGKPYRIAYVKLNASDVGSISGVTASLSGLIYDGELAENPIDICRAIVTWSAQDEYLIWNDYIDEETFKTARNHFRGLGITFSGELPAAQQTIAETIGGLLRFLADVDVSEGIMRILPLKATLPETAETLDEIHWFRITDPGVKYRWVTDRIQNHLKISYGKYLPGISENEQIIELKDQKSITEYKRVYGHAASEAVGMSLPYIQDEGQAKTIGQIWLDMYAFPFLEVYFTTPGLSRTPVQIGDEHLVLTDDIFPNRTSHNLGSDKATMKITGWCRNLQGRSVGFWARIYDVKAIEDQPEPWIPAVALPLIFDENSFDDGFYMG